MERTCPSCQQTVAQGDPHPGLVSLSKMQHSQLFKCHCCNSYLHLDQDGWEILSAGEYRSVNPLDHTRRSA